MASKEFPKYNEEGQRALIAYHSAVTFNSFEVTPPEQMALSERGRQAARLLNSGVFNCHTRQTATLCDIILGEDVSKHVRTSQQPQGVQHLSGAMITALNAVSGSLRGITYMVALTNRDGSVRVTPACGGDAITLHPTHFRRATEEEITAFFVERNGGAAQVPAPDPTSETTDDSDGHF